MFSLKPCSMPVKPNKSSHFFHELKRRNVFRVLAMYAGAAFVIIEVTNNVVDPLRLPPWLPTVIILLLIVGFPVTAILSWIFDLTPKGIERTEPLTDQVESQELAKDHRRRLRPSDFIILALLVAVGILVYPKIFNQDNFKESRESDGKISLAVLQFENRTGDTLFDIWQGGLQDLLITGLSDSEELSVRQYQSTNSVASQRMENYAGFSPRFAKEVAMKLDVRNLVRGTLMKAGGQVRMDAQIIDAQSNEIYKTFLVQGSSEDDFFLMMDTLSLLIKNYVEIKNIKAKRNSSLLEATGNTRSSEAYKYYIHGLDANTNMDMGHAAEWLSRAVEIDSSFTNAQVFLAHSYHMNNEESKAQEVVTHTYKEKDLLPLADRLMLEHLHAYFYETPYEEIKYAKQLVELDDINPMYLHILAVAHYKVFEYEEAVIYWERLFELHEKWGSEWQNPFAYFMLADSYHELGEPEKEGEIINLGVRLFPQNGYILSYRAIWALTQDDTEGNGQIMEDYLSFRHNVTNCPEALISTDFGFLYAKAGRMGEAEEKYRLAILQDPENLQYQMNLAKFLIDEEINVDEGLQIVEHILEKFPDRWALLHYKGWALYLKENYEEAAELIRVAWEHKPLYNHLLYMRLQEAEKALAS